MSFPRNLKQAIQSPFQKERLGEFFGGAKVVGNFTKDVLQGTARSGASVGATISEMFGGSNKIIPSNGIEKFLYGKDPIKSLTTRSLEAIPVTKELSKKYLGKDLNSFQAAGLAVPTVLGLTALDFTGGGKDDAFKSIAKSKNAKNILKDLTKLGVADDTAKILSKQLTKVDDVAKVKTIIGNFLPKKLTAKTGVFPKTLEEAVTPAYRRGDTVFIPGQNAVPINKYKVNDIGVFPKALRQGEVLPKSPMDKIGFNVSPVFSGQEGFVDAGQIATDVNKGLKTAKTQLIDRYAPIQDFVKGKGLKADADPYIAARNFAGRFGKVQNRLDNLSDILRPASGIMDKAKEYAKLERFEELAGRGITKFEGGLEAGQITTKKLALEAELGDKLPEVRTFVDQLRGYSENLLTEAKDAGILSQEAFDTIKKSNQKYIPLQRLEYLSDQADNLPRGAKSFSVATQDIIKGIKGSEKEIADPIESLVRNTYKTINLIERNKVAQKVADLSNLDEFKDLVVPLRTAEKVNERINIFSNLKELRPVKNKLERLMTTRNRWSRQIQLELNKLNKLGIQQYLKREAPKSLPKVQTNLTEKIKTKFGTVKTEMGDSFKAPFETKKTLTLENTPISSNDVKKLVNSLVQQSPESLQAIKNKIGTQDKYLANVLNELTGIRNEFSSVQTARNTLRASAKELADLNVPAGMDKLSLFRNGVKEEYAIPMELADSLKGLNEKNIDIVTQLAGTLGGFLRAGATSLNVGFIPANAIRDFQTATLVSKVGFTPWDWLKGFSEAIKKGDNYKAFLESGASYSGFFEQTKKLSKTVAQLKESKTLSTIKTIVNPIKLLQKVGETIELAPRLGVFKRSLKKGASMTESAFNAREATVDFAKSGSAMKVANLWIPFLNARTQGTLNTLKAVKQRPLRSAMVIGSMIEIPVVATYVNNTRLHKEVWEDIAQFEKDNNFIIIYGDERDEKGNPTQVVKIPKGDVGKVFGNPTEEFLNYLNGKDPKSIGQVVTEVFGNISPIGGVKNGEISGEDAISNILPPTIKAGVETVTNKNLFTGREIVPKSLQDASPQQQYDEKTAPIAVKLGEYFGISPMKIENFVGTQFGGLGRQVINPETAVSQVSGRFTGAKGGEDVQKDFRTLEELQTKDVDKRVIAERKAKKLYEEVKDLPKEMRAERIKDLMQRKEIDAEVLTELAQYIESEAKDYSSFEKFFKSQPDEVKAKFLVEKLKTLPKEERKVYFQELSKKGLLTKNLLEEFAREIKNASNE